MKVTLFGATGYLGSHAAEQMAAAGHQVTCLVRKNANTDFLESIDVQVVTIDFSDDLTMAKHMSNAVVCNCIADTRKHVSIEERRRVEIDLTTRLFRLAQQAKVSRFIQLSTVMAYGFDRPCEAIDENFKVPPKYIYNRVAAEREVALLGKVKEGNTELVILRPSNAIGPRDTSCLPNFEHSNRFGVFPVVSHGAWQFSCIDSRDVGRAMTHLLDVPMQKSEVFLVKGYDTSWLELKEGIDRITNKSTRLIRLPRRLMLWMGGVMEALYPYGSVPPLTRFDLEAISHHGLYSDAKIRKTGFKPVYELDNSLEGYFGAQE